MQKNQWNQKFFEKVNGINKSLAKLHFKKQENREDACY